MSFTTDELEITHNFANTKNKEEIFADTLKWTEQEM